jgi:hypothetical protein
MARLRTRGPSATKLVRDDDLVPMPIMAWGATHNLAPTEVRSASAAVAIGGPAHLKQGDASVVATVGAPYLPEGEWHELPVFEGDVWRYVSMISATGAGTIAAQIVERQ